jgi:hypothetical protein
MLSASLGAPNSRSVSGGEHRRINPATYTVESRDLVADIDLAVLPGARFAESVAHEAFD